MRISDWSSDVCSSDLVRTIVQYGAGRSRAQPLLMRFDTKIAIVLRDDVATWQKLNVACFLSGGLVGSYPELAGERYRDASGRDYGPLIRQPILVFAASGEDLARTLQRSEEHTSELQSLMRISYAVFCLQ